MNAPTPALPEESPEEILATRAAALAEPDTKEEESGDSVEVIEFALAGERYAVETALVCEALCLRGLTPVPCTPAWVAGVINLHGTIVAVLDLRSFFGLPGHGIGETGQVIVLSDRKTEAGLLADAILGVREVRRDDLRGGLPTLLGIRADYLLGVREDGLAVLDAAKLLSSDRLSINEEP